MAKLNVDSLGPALERAKQKRLPNEARYDKAFRYSMPARRMWFKPIDDAGSQGYDAADIFDDTAVIGIQEFASRLQSGLIPIYSKWSKLTPGMDVPPEQKEKVATELEPVTDTIFETIQNSNFDTEIVEAILDLGVSAGFLEVREGDALQVLVHEAIPMSTMWIDDGPDGRIDKYFWGKMYSLEQLDVKYPLNTIPADLRKTMRESGKSMPFMEAIIRCWDQPATEKWYKYVWYEKDKAMVFIDEWTGAGSCPMIGFRWGKGAGEVWGRGPLLNCMPSVLTLNLVKEMILENGQMAISGVYQADDDGTINVDQIVLVPGTIIPRAPNTTGITRIDTASDFNVADFVIADMQANIKRALYNDMLGNPNKTPMSATEVSERMADLARQIGSAYGRLMVELVIPYIQRVVYILSKRKTITIPVVNGRTIKVTSTSPLSNAQNFEDISNVSRLCDFVIQKFGPQLANVFLKGEEVIPYVGDKLQVPKSLYRSKPEMKQIIGAVAGMAQSGQVPPELAGGEGAPAVAA